MLFTTLLFAAAVVALPPPSPYAHHHARREANFTQSALEVDLGYSVYQGSYDNASNFNVFKGITVRPRHGWEEQMASPQGTRNEPLGGHSGH